MLPNFSWVIENELAGMAHPGTSETQVDETLRALERRGIRAIVTLTTHPLPSGSLERAEFSALHLPIPDFTPPSPAQVDRLLRFFDEQARSHAPVVIHCAAGLGRTGTMLACCLVHRGHTADEAIARVRRQRPGSVETPDQEALVRHIHELRRASA